MGGVEGTVGAVPPVLLYWVPGANLEKNTCFFRGLKRECFRDCIVPFILYVTLLFYSTESLHPPGRPVTGTLLGDRIKIHLYVSLRVCLYKR
jgi:hypothetical protein